MTGKTRQRTCIVCRQTDNKGSLLRIVRTPQGSIQFDPTGKMNGRGAYVCSVSCFEKAISTKRLESALRIKVTDEDRDRVADELRASLSHDE